MASPLSKAFYLRDLIQVKPGRIASRKLHLEGMVPSSQTAPDWVLYAMDQGETISLETAPHGKFILVLEGELTLSVAGVLNHMPQGASILIAADTWHEFAAVSPCIFIQQSIIGS